MADLQAQLQSGLSGRYALERELGRGGMATVYLARDLRHDRPVALKVLHPELAATLGPERFEREIKLAARLQHPHILTVLDSGEVHPERSEGPPRLWFTMPFIEGESLRQRLDRVHQIPAEEAVRLTLEAADALEYAHQRGVIHRDIKPENILLTGSHALVADFGVAKALHGAGSQVTAAASGHHSITGTGVAIGTPAYMSPEQATGSRELDARTDIYSLGSVLYEMLAGEPPFTGPTVQAIIAKRLATDPTPLDVVRPDLPPKLAKVVARAMHRTPAERYQSAAAFARDLDQAMRPASGAMTAAARAGGAPWYRRAAAIFLLGLVVGLGVLFAWRRSRGDEQPAAGGPKRLAVLPFDNQGSRDDDYFADGITDEIRGKLATLPGLQVTASRSAASYKGTSKTMQQIASELGVNYLLVGKIRWEKIPGAQSRVRVSPELIDVAKGATQWQQPFDASITDVFQVQADIAGKVAAALNVALSEGQQAQLGARPTENLAAYDAYLRGNEIAGGFAQTPAVDIRRALGQYERAVALDSTFALAWANLSRALSRITFLGTARGDERTRAKTAAERSLALAPQLGAAHLALGEYYYNVRSDWRASLEQYSAASKLSPQDPDVLVSLSRSLESAGRWEEAVTALKHAQTVDPRSVSPARALAIALLWMRRYPEALEAAQRAVTLSPQHPAPRETQAMVYLAQGDLPGAQKIIRQAVAEVDPTAIVIYMAQYWDLYWALDDEQQQLALRLPLVSFDEDVFGRAIVLAELYDLRGDPARARAFADTAVAEAARRIKSAPDDPYLRIQNALALAYLGRKPEAVKEAERAIASQSSAEDGYSGPYNEHLAARVYLRTGQPEKALAILEHLLKIPYYLSPAWLRIDPEWKPLHGNPRFAKLVKAGEG
jgi:TolB-like protein/Tfp pilus assembly protein PilF